MTHEDLFKKEISNLYALTKQVNSYLNGSLIEFLEPKHKDVVENYLSLNCELEEQLVHVLKDMDINPGNTTDSIVEEITENLEQIAAEKIERPIKALGYRMSLNRLFCYETANLENVQSLMPVEEVTRDLQAYLEQIEGFKKSLL